MTSGISTTAASSQMQVDQTSGMSPFRSAMSAPTSDPITVVIVTAKTVAAKTR